MSGKMERLERFIDSFSNWLNWVAGAGLLAILGLTIADIFGIKLAQAGVPFFRPIPGGIEVVAFLGVVVTAFAIAYTQRLRGHIRVEFVVMRLPERVQAGIAAFIWLLSFILFALLAWQSVEYGLSLQAKGTVSMTQRIPFYPFVHAIAFCCIPVCMALALEVYKSIRKAVRG
ncbi:MAG: TRAP transporter small permease [Dehalococcoidia bacterium]|jgi:TRAP-type C4-dicarboxylate transport system permease small subunit